MGHQNRHKWNPMKPFIPDVMSAVRKALLGRRVLVWLFVVVYSGGIQQRFRRWRFHCDFIEKFVDLTNWISSNEWNINLLHLTKKFRFSWTPLSQPHFHHSKTHHHHQVVAVVPAFYRWYSQKTLLTHASLTPVTEIQSPIDVRNNKFV